MNDLNRTEGNPFDAAWEGIKREFDTACVRAAQAARRGITGELNQFFRRLRHYESEADWYTAILDCASKFVSQVAVFAVNGDQIEGRVQRNLDLPEGYGFKLQSAGAFAAAVESKDSLVALRSAGEVGGALSTENTTGRAHLFPIVNGSRVVAVLFAVGQDDIDLNALELIASFGSAALERRANNTGRTQIAPAPMPARQSDAAAAGKSDDPRAAAGAVSRTLPSWADLGEEARSHHMKAQRFARVAVAEMQLFRPDACLAGREQNNLYLYLKKEIDKARQTYRTRFSDVPSMVDYLHLELVNIAAHGEESKLGAEYPGPLV